MDPEETGEGPAAPPELGQPQELAGARDSEPPAPPEPSPAQPETPTPEPAPAGGEAQPEPIPPSAPAGEAAPPPPPSEAPMEELSRPQDIPTIRPSVGREAKMRKLEKRLGRVLAVARERGAISNRDIREALHVSRATASRYAKILISRDLLKLSGRTRSAKYEPK